MRYIKRDHIAFPEGWQKQAEKAYYEVKSLPPAERKEAINRRSAIWKALKEELQRCSHGKCWYCESPTTATAPGDVDHYRPKNAVDECPQHGGYWWLAFDWDNYRYSCELCNRLHMDVETNVVGGKATHFPLCDERKRAFSETPERSVLFEEPMLLDPVVASDPPLLTFNEEGMAVPARTDAASIACQRAKKSIELYHLNRSKLKNWRQFYGNKVRSLVDDGEKFLLLYVLENSVAAREGYNAVCNQLSSMIQGDAPYAAAAKAMLRRFRDKEWVMELLDAA